ncbi:MAG: hypothetical protein LKM32_11095 [Chiayiivirga sp.]|jgi:hypothetical protein|uniref:FFLEELY motif protein n=1 Tax=Chiayiivirga sp. TaxID=2041042 RepID=UPI0025B874D8|nr:hypothetical protein [Chiayiivirga sp.]MCI1709796.1 hypothetical protein [Chiayiivirga sp.]MCI1729897.1 hypothetical protein [Chiayiivirga sp.]
MSSNAALDRRLHRVLEANRRGRDPVCEPRNRSAWIGPLQRWQAARLGRSFIDFLAQPQTEAAARFFLDDLYGDHDVSARDRDVERVLPLMRKLLPPHLIETAADAIELAWLSHAFDLRLAQALQGMLGPKDRIDEASYARAYRLVGKPRLRARQIDLILRIGATLDHAVHKPWIPRLLRASRLPAKLAGLGELQGFLERGFAAFRRLQGADHFLNEIARREGETARRLLAGAPKPFEV